jgi:hypothetical protein
MQAQTTKADPMLTQFENSIWDWIVSRCQENILVSGGLGVLTVLFYQILFVLWHGPIPGHCSLQTSKIFQSGCLARVPHADELFIAQQNLSNILVIFLRE